MSESQDPVLTFRIALDTAPDLDAANVMADASKAAGLEVLTVSPLGLMVSGRKSLIERKLSAHIDWRTDLVQFTVQPKFENLPAGTKYRAYFPRGPTYFRGS